MSQEMKPIDEAVYQAIGEASLCWSETPKGVFESTKAKKIADELIEKLNRRYHVESLIRGHMEAMRPLLDEWSGRL